MKNILFLTAMLSTLLFSCNKDENEVLKEVDNNTIGDFAFCKTGNQWTYANYNKSEPDISFNSSVKITSIDQTGLIKVRITWPVTAYDVWWYAHDNCFGEGSPSTYLLYLYKKDAKVGDIYEITLPTDDGAITNRNEVVALNQSITVIAGTYTGCTKIRQTTSEDAVFYSDIWFSPEIGIIKNEGTTAADFPEISVTELHSTNF